MTKRAAFGSKLKMGTGEVQIETATTVGAITGTGDAHVTVTCTGMAGTPMTLHVPVVNLDTNAVATEKMRAYMLSTPAITALFWVTGTGADIVLTRKIPIATIANLNIATDNGTCTGLTPVANSVDTHAGEAAWTEIAQVQKIGGPGLAADTTDVTTHDSPSAFEEVVACILRSGEMSLDIVYDPGHATHDATTGLVEMYENETLVGYQLIWPGPYQWDFAAFVTGFTPDAPHAGGLTATVKMKLTGVPTLA